MAIAFFSVADLTGLRSVIEFMGEVLLDVGIGVKNRSRINNSGMGKCFLPF